MAANEDPFNYNIVEYRGMKFVISCSPCDRNIQRFIDLWKAEGVKNVVRVCESTTYSTAPLQAEGITVHVCDPHSSHPPPHLFGSSPF